MNIFLLLDTIRNNILYSAPQATQCDFENAIKATGVIDAEKGKLRDILLVEKTKKYFDVTKTTS